MIKGLETHAVLMLSEIAITSLTQYFPLEDFQYQSIFVSLLPSLEVSVVMC